MPKWNWDSSGLRRGPCQLIATTSREWSCLDRTSVVGSGVSRLTAELQRDRHLNELAITHSYRSRAEQSGLTQRRGCAASCEGLIAAETGAEYVRTKTSSAPSSLRQSRSSSIFLCLQTCSAKRWTNSTVYPSKQIVRSTMYISSVTVHSNTVKTDNFNVYRLKTFNATNREALLGWRCARSRFFTTGEKL